MNPFVFSCITPHGGEIIPELSGALPERMHLTRSSMQNIGKKMQAANPDVIIVLTPHGTRIDGMFSISHSEKMSGILEEHGATYEMTRDVDRELAAAITEAAQNKGIPAASINFGAAAGPASQLRLDWGVIVPLAFMPHVPIVVINPSRELPFDQHMRFGQVISQSVQKSEKRVALIASCDWSHAHDLDGPYGFHPAAKALDEEVIHYMKNNELEKLADLDPDYIEAAKPDGIWQTIILAGAIPAASRRIQFLSYEVPTYFGLICAEVQ
ncbi:extradiol ring-cleavage dioxygenase [Virgibacillus halophilus]|uniref:Extradiol ring-cleavage dioxygenase n=1 Tax=Tigheibacillus halophilus TaxID=361280 RepID=A0ABU5C8N5_9BACI|nr:extradiol ring-cleavage dioxygenase [Virgibacillus halophilus]